MRCKNEKGVYVDVEDGKSFVAAEDDADIIVRNKLTKPVVCTWFRITSKSHIISPGFRSELIILD